MIVTGGGSGIGAAIALLYAQEGAAVIVADRSAERAEKGAVRVRSGGRRAVLAVDGGQFPYGA